MRHDSLTHIALPQHCLFVAPPPSRSFFCRPAGVLQYAQVCALLVKCKSSLQTEQPEVQLQSIMYPYRQKHSLMACCAVSQRTAAAATLNAASAR